MRSRLILKAAPYLVGIAFIGSCNPGPKKSAGIVLREAPPNPSAVWPWRNAEPMRIHKGVTHWLVASSLDGCSLDLFQFDFLANPRLKFGIHDADQDDKMPFDNKAIYGRMDPAIHAKYVEVAKGSTVLMACNGPYFSYTGSPGDRDSIGSHIGPVVLDGNAHYNLGSHRWTFGVLKGNGAPHFDAQFRPSFDSLESHFSFAADGLQLLVRNGKPTRLRPAARTVEEEKIRPLETSADAGSIPFADRIRASRTSLAWSKDSRFLYVLVVRSPSTELENALAFKHGKDPGPGWTLKDLQSFWLSLGAWGAFNSDGGRMTQLCYREKTGGRIQVLPAEVGPVGRVLLFPTHIGPLNGGGSLMAYYVFEK